MVFLLQWKEKSKLRGAPVICSGYTEFAYYRVNFVRDYQLSPRYECHIVFFWVIPLRWHIKFRRQAITQKKEHNKIHFFSILLTFHLNIFILTL